MLTHMDLVIFKGDLTIQLLNWREDKRHVEKTVHFNDNTSLQTRSMVIEGERASSGIGYDKFISLTDLSYNSVKNTEYQCNVTLHFNNNHPVIYPSDLIIAESEL